jgi:hypothetical protein
MSDYRTPEEDQQQEEQVARITQVLSQAISNAAYLKVAMHLREPQDVVELWVDKAWDGLRDQLDGEDRLAAILLLLDDRINREFRTILRPVPEVPGA